VRRGAYYTGYTWTITFLTPMSYVEPLIVDPSTMEVSMKALLGGV
jgi:hypothetical protein